MTDHVVSKDKKRRKQESRSAGALNPISKSSLISLSFCIKTRPRLLQMKHAKSIKGSALLLLPTVCSKANLYWAIKKLEVGRRPLNGWAAKSAKPVAASKS